MVAGSGSQAAHYEPRVGVEECSWAYHYHVAQHSFPYKLWLFSRQWFVYFLVQIQRPRLWALRAQLAGVDKLFISVAFNQPQLVRLQLESLRLFADPGYRVVVVDSSTRDDKRKEIRRACETFDALYLRGPWNLFSYFQGSLSHSSTLDWLWHGLLKSMKNSVVGFLDHDIFLIDRMDDSYFSRDYRATGRKELRAGKWAFWPGLLVLPVSELAKPGITFMPYRELDSGGSLWLSLYRKHPENDFRFLSREFFEVTDGSRVEASSVEVIDGRWVHLIDGSGWLDGTGKFDRIFGTDLNTEGQLSHTVENLRSMGVDIPSL